MGKTQGEGLAPIGVAELIRVNRAERWGTMSLYTYGIG
jgi:hypothetical protein